MNKVKAVFVLAVLLGLVACQNTAVEKGYTLKRVAASDKQWTGVAVSQEKRIFVNFPYWSDDVSVSVAEIVDGQVVPYPSAVENKRGTKYGFNAVQSVVVDAKNRLWILDTNNPQFKGVTPAGPKLHRVNLSTNHIDKTYSFPKGVFQPNSYFNDVRVDTVDEVAYMTDSGNGALIVLDLKSGKSRRVLDGHKSTESEVNQLICDGVTWKNTVHSDGIGLSLDRKYIYYVALTAYTLYRIPTKALNDEVLTEAELAKYVEQVKKIPATDGIMFDREGNLWLGGLENNEVNLLKPNGDLVTVAQGAEIRWADSFALGPDGSVYFTTSQIHLPVKDRKKYEVIKIK